ncbi:MAG TPA: DUF58 domain-containing protein [Verrucomicrobiae bacterium]|jgi:uncharacterized protein (DUF58 family)|nr:DUF58 domain-containing protein [Verrucomicrobiae bacterium]
MKWIFATLAILALGLIFRLNLLVYAMYALLGILLLSRFFTRHWTEKTTVRRRCSGDVFEIGQSCKVAVEIKNESPLSVPWLLIEDALSRDALSGTPLRLKVNGGRLDIIRLKPGETTELEYQVTFLTRGYFQLGPLLLETGDVFGLHRRFRVAGEPHFALVLPKVLPLQGYNLASRRPIGEIRVTHRLFEDPTRLAGVRPYQHGDPLNRIHWRATARTGELHSRTYETSRVAGATFLLDFHVDNLTGANAMISAELAIVAVASLANAVYLMGQQTGFVSNGRDAADRIREEGWRAEFLTRDAAQQRAIEPTANTRLRPVRVENGKGLEKLNQIFEILARLELTDGLNFSEMIAAAASQIPRDATVIAVLHHVTPETATALGELARRGFLVTAVVVAFAAEPIPDWARPPEWAGLLLAHGVDFRLVNSEEAITDLCAEAIIR